MWIFLGMASHMCIEAEPAVGAFTTYLANKRLLPGIDPLMLHQLSFSWEGFVTIWPVALVLVWCLVRMLDMFTQSLRGRIIFVTMVTLEGMFPSMGPNMVLKQSLKRKALVAYWAFSFFFCRVYLELVVG